MQKNRSPVKLFVNTPGLHDMALTSNVLSSLLRHTYLALVATSLKLFNTDLGVMGSTEKVTEGKMYVINSYRVRDRTTQDKKI